MKKNQVFFFCWLLTWTAACLFILHIWDGVGDHADGLMHYMFARYAHLHPANFLDPWAKTGYTLLAWPFAQWGLKGVMLLNILCAGTCMWLVYRICQQLKIKQAWIAPVILSLSTYYVELLFSGLTEHAFSLVLTLAVFCLLRNRWMLGSLILSTLPFFRQEGYIIMVALLPFYIYRGKLIYIPLLAVSFVLVAITGGIYYSDLFWIVRSNPYALHQSYGSGHWWDFCIKLYYSIGFVNLVLFIVGVVMMLAVYTRSGFTKNQPFILAVFLPFFFFFTAHSAFWALGIFHSMGLQRVLNCVTPLMAVIAAYGATSLAGMFPSRIRNIVVVLTGLLVLIFPFTSSPSSIGRKDAFKKTEFESMLKDVCQHVKFDYPDRYLYFEHPMVPYFYQVDPFDPAVSSRLFLLDLGHLKPGALIFWENGLTPGQSGITKEQLETDPHLSKVLEVYTTDQKNNLVVYQADQ